MSELLTRPPLTVEAAEITTAAVEIKTLTVKGKQVTLAVFRQLIEQPVIDPETGAFAGNPWGVVNYHPDRCADDKPHLHVVWQQGDELRRARVYQPRWYSEWFWSDGEADAYLEAHINASRGNWPDWAKRRRDPRAHDPEYSVIFEYRGITCDTSYESRVRRDTDRDAPTVAVAQQWLDEAIDAELARRQAVSQRWSELCSLPQLFIAV